MSRRYWIIGASTGIGLELCRLLLARGDQVFASSRRPGELEQLTQQYPLLTYLPLDVQDHQACREAAQGIAEEGGLDVLVANAGVCHYVDLPQMDMDLVQQTFNVNVIAMMHLTQLCLPMFRANARLVYVSSAAAYLPLPRAQSYGASKAALSHYAEIMASELQGTGVGVTVVYPGFVDTPLTAQNDFPMPMRLSASQAASIMLKGMDKGKSKVQFPALFIWFLRAVALLPTPWRRALIRKSSRYQGNTPL